MDPLPRTLHYRAAGETVTLRPDREHVAVDLRQLDAPQASALEETAGTLSRLNDHLVVVPRHRLDPPLAATLMAKGALLPVFEADGARLVALPEVRVEPPADPGDQTGLEQLEVWLGEHRDRVAVVARKSGRLVLAPLSGYGPDAVTLANDITTEFDALTASPRFVRITSRPIPAAE